MKPDWDKLMAEYADHPSTLIGDVDCTAEGKPLCETHGVEGFPTIKYGDPNNLESYEGGRDLEALEAFAKENLGPTCGPANLDLCDAEKKKKVEELMAMPIDSLAKEMKEKDAAIKKLEDDFAEMLKGLQEQYEQADKDTKEGKEKIKKSGLGTMKQVLAIRQKQDL